MDEVQAARDARAAALRAKFESVQKEESHRASEVLSANREAVSEDMARDRLLSSMSRREVKAAKIRARMEARRAWADQRHITMKVRDVPAVEKLPMLPGGVPDGHVYFVQSGVFVKVGYTSVEDPQDRIAGLRTGSPQRIETLFVIPGTALLERLIHDEAFQYHHHGEWFVQCRGLDAVIRKYKPYAVELRARRTQPY